MTKHCPLLKTQNTLRLLLTAWTSYHSVTTSDRDRPTKFQAAPKIPE
ncbi:hypothetical protein [Microcoleus sp. herbarium14]